MGELGERRFEGEAVAISGSEFAESRRRSMREAATTFLLVDGTSRIRMAAGVPELVGSSLGDVIDAPVWVIERSITAARLGTETAIPVSAGTLGPKGVRCLPLRGEPGRDGLVLVVVSDGRPAADPEVEQLRARAEDLEAVTRASGALARAGEPDSARRTACETALEVAGADIAVLLELGREGGITVAAATSPGLDGRSTPLEPGAMAMQALQSGELALAERIDDRTAWPLARAGVTSAAWQPVPPAAGARWILAIGWGASPRPEPERLRWMLSRVAEEAAVAIERADATEQLTGLARTDPLTELSNRRAWQEELNREMAKAERGGLRLSVGLIDLDELKAFNDTWGHAAGDRVLLTAAARWRRRLRLTDLIARIGGDEFAVAIPGCSLSEAMALGDELRRALPDGLTCSIGVAEWALGESAADLVARADEALYAAKNSGRNATFSVPGSAGAAVGGSVPST